jgi:preprotein translocase SecE subunit
MAFGLYKPGQGYWVRVMTATVAAIVALAAAAWLWRTLQPIQPPVKAWTVEVRPASGTAVVGDTIALMSAATPTAPAASIGSGVVQTVSIEGTTARLTLGEFRQAGSTAPTAAKSVAPGPAGAATLAGPILGSPVAIRAFDPMYIQAAGVGVLIVGGTLLIYWLVGARPGTSEFLIATDGEMKKVNWSTRKNIIDSTWVVIGYSVLLAVGLFLVDLMFRQFFHLIRVLE